jgi:DNA mismatch repair protein MSH4
MLDVSRAAYEENVRDAEELCLKTGEESGIAISLKYQAGGFVFTFKKEEVDLASLPKHFINRVGPRVASYGRR